MVSVFPKAILAFALGYSPKAIAYSSDDHQKGHGVPSRALSHGRWVHPRQVDRAILPARRLCTYPGRSLTQLAVAFMADASSFIQRIGRQTSARLPSQLPGANPIASHNALPNQQLIQIVADRLHSHNRVLSEATSSAGFKTSQKELQGRGISIQELGFIRARERSHD